MAATNTATDTLVAEDKARSEALIREFKGESVLNQGKQLNYVTRALTLTLGADQSGRRISILGSIRSQPGLLLLERAAFPSSLAELTALQSGLVDVTNLGANDIYNWYMSSLSPSASRPDLKMNLIWPCAPSHVAKYSPQTARMVTETPSVFARFVRPYMVRKTQDGRLNWVYNIIEGRQEQQDIILRRSRNLGHDPDGFLLLPDMNWDRSTMTSLRLLALVERRDLLSLRDLTKRHVPWLTRMWSDLQEAVAAKYHVEPDMLKAYLHYQPTYYHFHVHIVSVAMEPNATQAVGKAFSLPNLVAQLDSMAGGPDAGLKDVDLTYAIGDGSELWEQVFQPLKEGREPAVVAGE